MKVLNGVSKGSRREALKAGTRPGARVAGRGGGRGYGTPDGALAQRMIGIYGNDTGVKWDGWRVEILDQKQLPLSLLL